MRRHKHVPLAVAVVAAAAATAAGALGAVSQPVAASLTSSWDGQR